MLVRWPPNKEDLEPKHLRGETRSAFFEYFRKLKLSVDALPRNSLFWRMFDQRTRACTWTREYMSSNLSVFWHGLTHVLLVLKQHVKNSKGNNADQYRAKAIYVDRNAQSKFAPLLYAGNTFPCIAMRLMRFIVHTCNDMKYWGYIPLFVLSGVWNNSLKPQAADSWRPHSAPKLTRDPIGASCCIVCYQMADPSYPE